MHKYLQDARLMHCKKVVLYHNIFDRLLQKKPEAAKQFKKKLCADFQALLFSAKLSRCWENAVYSELEAYILSRTWLIECNCQGFFNWYISPWIIISKHPKQLGWEIIKRKQILMSPKSVQYWGYWLLILAILQTEFRNWKNPEKSCTWRPHTYHLSPFTFPPGKVIKN